MKRSSTNRLYLKKQLYTLHMDGGKDFKKHLDDFNGIMLDLIKGDQEIILLSSLPKPYEHFVDTLLYGKQILTMLEVKVALNSK